MFDRKQSCKGLILYVKIKQNLLSNIKLDWHPVNYILQIVEAVV